MQFKDLNLNEKVQSALYVLMVPAMIYTEHKEELYTLLAFGSIYAVATQPWELYKTKRPGVVDIRLIIVYGLSSIFWVTYAFSVRAPALMITCPLISALILLTGGMWAIYSRRSNQ